MCVALSSTVGEFHSIGPETAKLRMYGHTKDLIYARMYECVCGFMHIYMLECMHVHRLCIHVHVHNV